MVQQPEPTQQAGLSQPPPHQWVPAPTPPSYASGPANMRYFAAQMKAGCPLPPTPPTPSFQPTESFFPHFNKATDLAHRLGVKPTIETVKRLEMAQQEMARKPHDPHPNKSPKRVHLSQKPRGEAQGFIGKGKGKAKDNDEVSLDYSGDEMEGYYNDEEMEEVTDTAGLTFLRQVQTTHERTMTRGSSQLDNYISELCINKICL